jgi:hypothetical protein
MEATDRKVLLRMKNASRTWLAHKMEYGYFLAFYDAPPDAAVLEDATWGQVGAAGLAALVESEAHEDIYESAPKAGAR